MTFFPCDVVRMGGGGGSMIYEVGDLYGASERGVVI